MSKASIKANQVKQNAKRPPVNVRVSKADKAVLDKIRTSTGRSITWMIQQFISRLVAGSLYLGALYLAVRSSADVGTVASARAVFFNGLNEEFEPWLEPLLKQAAFKGTKVVVTRGVRTLTAEEEHPVSGRQHRTACSVGIRSPAASCSGRLEKGEDLVSAVALLCARGR